MSSMNGSLRTLRTLPRDNQALMRVSIGAEEEALRVVCEEGGAVIDWFPKRKGAASGDTVKDDSSVVGRPYKDNKEAGKLYF